MQKAQSYTNLIEDGSKYLLAYILFSYTLFNNIY